MSTASLSSNSAQAETTATARALPPVLGRLLSGTIWLALRIPIQAVTSLLTTRLIVEGFGVDLSGAYKFAWGFGFFQMLFEFGISSALQRQISESWTKGDKDGVDRAVACGLNFYLAMAFVQVVALLGVAYWALPHTAFTGEPYRLIVKLLWIQILTAPCYGISVVVSSVLQAARRYDFLPRLEFAVTILRFLALYLGVRAGADLLLIVIVQTLIQVGLILAPGLWVMVHDLGQMPRLRGARWDDYKVLGHISFFMALIQISVVLADKVDTTILGFMITDDPGRVNTIYDVVSKPFLQLRQTGWTLAYMVMPAVASLAAAKDLIGMEKVKYDGSRLHICALLPIGLLGWIYAGPFLYLWMGNLVGEDTTYSAYLMRLFLTAALPLVLSVPVQMAIGVKRIEVIALAAIGGSLINLPISCYLTSLWGVEGTIWGTVLTTFFSNLIIPGIYVFRVLEIDRRTYFTRTLLPLLSGAFAAVASTWLLRQVYPVTYPGTTIFTRAIPLLIHLAVGTAAYILGYLATPTGRADLHQLLAKLRRRRAATA